MEKAFIDFLSVLAARSFAEDAQRCDKKADAERDIEVINGTLPVLEEKLKKLEEREKIEDNLNKQKEHKENLKFRQRFLKDLSFVESYERDFSPGKSAPEVIENSVKETYDTYWKKKNVDASGLDFLASRFREFWQTHDYHKRWETNNSARVAGAVEATKIREEKKWLIATRTFLQAFPPDQRTIENARRFKAAGVNAKDCGEFFALLVEARNRKNPVEYAERELEHPA